jgi:hypothetical protein
MTDATVVKLNMHLRLTPYQLYVLGHNISKYDAHGVMQRGDVVYAPYAHDDATNVWDFLCRIFIGPRADLIGANQMLAYNQRGIKLCAHGYFSAIDSFGRYYADASGNRINRRTFRKVISV